VHSLLGFLYSVTGEIALSWYMRVFLFIPSVLVRSIV